MTAQVNIILNEVRNTVSIPTAALGEVQSDGRRQVWVSRGKGTVESRWIRIGIDDSSVVQVLDGLKSGEQVVLEGAASPQATPTHRAGRPEMAGPLLELHGVRREYASGAGVYVALDHLSLRIDAGELIAIVGASGSGKSTLMNILGCLDRPTAGTYRVAGQEVSRMSTDERSALRRERFGFVFQRYNLLPDLTAVDNVAVPAVYAGQDRGRRRARATALLTRLKLQDHLHHRPNQLSGGQQQRVSIARALMNGGEIILADEPTGALDSPGGRGGARHPKRTAQQGVTRWSSSRMILRWRHTRSGASSSRTVGFYRIATPVTARVTGMWAMTEVKNRPAARPSRSALAELGDRFGRSAAYGSAGHECQSRPYLSDHVGASSLGSLPWHRSSR